jgi:hypothetical protein
VRGGCVRGQKVRDRCTMLKNTQMPNNVVGYLTAIHHEEKYVLFICTLLLCPLHVGLPVGRRA